MKQRAFFMDKDELPLFFLFNFIWTIFFGSVFEFFDSAAQTTHKFRDFSTTKKQQNNDNNKCNLPRADRKGNK